MKKMIILFFIINYLLICDAKSNDVIGLTDEIYYKFSGIWNTSRVKTGVIEKDFSWGESLVIPNSWIIIDLKNKKPFPYISGGPAGNLRIIGVKKISDDKYNFIVTSFDDEHKFEFEIVINLKSDGTIWLEKSYGFFPTYLVNSTLYRLDGPKKETTNIKKYSPTIDNLPLP